MAMATKMGTVVRDGAVARRRSIANAHSRSIFSLCVIAQIPIGLGLRNRCAAGV
jgi:hypothetical protein